MKERLLIFTGINQLLLLLNSIFWNDKKDFVIVDKMSSLKENPGRKRAQSSIQFGQIQERG